MRAYESEFLTQLVEQYTPVLRKLCGYYMNYVEDDVSECVQQVFELAALNVDRLMGRADISKWMYWAAANMCRKKRRNDHTRAKRSVDITQVEDLLSIEIPFEDIVITDEEIASAKQKVISRLNDKERKLYDLCYKEKLSKQQIADLEGVSLKAIRLRVTRLNMRLRELVKIYFSE